MSKEDTRKETRSAIGKEGPLSSADVILGMYSADTGISKSERWG
jgi:hypothetical protein